MNSDPVSLKVVVVGDGSVGKTCILVSYTTDKFPTEYVPTVFDNYTSQIEVDNQMVSLSLWDTAGQETYNRLRTLSYAQADVFLIVFSVVERNTFENALYKWHPELSVEKYAFVPKLLIGNKIDMRSESSSDHIQRATAQQLADNIKAKYIECSALTSVGLKDVFEEGVKAGLKYKNSEILRSQIDQKNNSNIKKQQDSRTSGEKPCCNVM